MVASFIQYKNWVQVKCAQVVIGCRSILTNLARELSMMAVDSIQPDNAYCAKKLCGIKLEKVYELASARVGRYLRAEIELMASKLEPGLKILELGCGYGTGTQLVPADECRCSVDAEQLAKFKVPFKSFLNFRALHIFFQLCDVHTHPLKNPID